MLGLGLTQRLWKNALLRLTAPRCKARTGLPVSIFIAALEQAGGDAALRRGLTVKQLDLVHALIEQLSELGLWIFVLFELLLLHVCRQLGVDLAIDALGALGLCTGQEGQAENGEQRREGNVHEHSQQTASRSATRT